MRCFSWMYRKTLGWAEHPYATYLLAGVSFSEASFFPIPPDVIMIPMALSAPKRAWYLAGLTTVFSVLGGVFGYALGAWLLHLLMPWIVHWGYAAAYAKVQHWFDVYGFWALFVAGFSPIPYKLFTLAAGAAHLALLPFIAASFLGRAGRFFLVAALIACWGDAMRERLHSVVDALGWTMVVMLPLAYVMVQSLGGG